MEQNYQQIINGPAQGMIAFIRSNHIGIDVRRLEALDEGIRMKHQSVSPDFLLESKRVRQELKAWLASQDQ